MCKCGWPVVCEYGRPVVCTCGWPAVYECRRPVVCYSV